MFCVCHAFLSVHCSLVITWERANLLAWYHKTSISPPVKVFLLTVPRQCIFCGSFLLFMFCVCHAFLSVHSSIVVTFWERANLLALLYVMFSCVFITFPCGVLGQVWYLIVSIPDICLLTFFSYSFDALLVIEKCFSRCKPFLHVHVCDSNSNTF